MKQTLLSAALLFALAGPACAFELSPRETLTLPAEAEAVAFGDVTGDGRGDLVVATTWSWTAADGSKLYVLAHDAFSNAFVVRHEYKFHTSGSNNAALALADLTGDGVLDIVLAGPNKQLHTLSIAAGALHSRTYTAPIDNYVLQAIDVDRDGAKEIVGQSWSSGAAVYYGDGNGGIARHAPLATPAAGYNDLAVGDLNGDGIDDLAVMSGQSYSVPNLTVFRHDGVGALREHSRHFVGSSELTGGVAIGDFDGDRRRDVALSRNRNSSTHLWIYRQEANGELAALPTTLASSDVPADAAAGDIDGDGRDDLVVVHAGWSRIGLYLQGDTGLQPERLFAIDYASQYGAQAIQIADLNGDGCRDVVVAGRSSGVQLLYGSACVPPPPPPPPVPKADLAVALAALKKGFDVQVSHRGGDADATAVITRVDISLSAKVQLTPPAACTLAASTSVKRTYVCGEPSLGIGGSKGYAFAASGPKNSTLEITAEVTSDIEDPNTANNRATLQQRL